MSPVDFGMENLTLLTAFLSLPDPNGTEDEKIYWDTRSPLKDFANVCRLAGKKSHWEGDFKEGPYLWWLPDGDNEFVYAFAWKQHNNGTTYVASPVKLSWLDAYEV
jgi:hypothetical protein